MRHFARMNEAFRTYELCISHVRMIAGIAGQITTHGDTKEARHFERYKRGMSLWRMRHVTRTNEACRTYE